MSEEKREAEEVVPPVPVKRRAGVMSAVFDLYTSSKPGAKPDLPRKTVEVTIAATSCAPGVFEEDFELTLRATTAKDELRIARAHKGDVGGYQFALARSCIYLFNGEPLKAGEDEVLWEALSPAGRNTVLVAWTMLTAPSDEAMGKAMGSLKISG